MSKTSGADGSDIFISLLTVLFIGLKLTGYIDWSWWWVLSPIWAMFALALVVFIICAIIRSI